MLRQTNNLIRKRTNPDEISSEGQWIRPTRLIDGGAQLFGIVATGAIMVTVAITLNWSSQGRVFFTTCALTVAATLLFVWWVARVHASASVLAAFTTLFSAFHFGLLAAHMTGQQVPTLLGGVLRWYLQETLVLAAFAASLLFLLGLAMAAALTLSTGKSKVSTFAVTGGAPLRHSPITILLGVAVLAWLAIVPGILGITNYTQYNAIARNEASGIYRTALTVLYPMIAALFFWASVSARQLTWPFIIYFVFAAVAFPIGLRGEVLFPLAMVAPTLVAQARLNLPLPMIVGGAYSVMLVSSFGRIFRADSNLSEAIQGASGLTGLAELGGSLRPVVEVRRWLDSGVDQLRWGETYYAPFERTFQRLIPIFDRSSAFEDDRLMNTLLVARTSGNYGFSAAAEALINFGMLGCFIVGALFGWALIAFGKRASHGTVPIIGSALVFGMFIHIRQGFVTAYGSAIMFLVISLILICLFPSRDRHFSSSTIDVP